MKALITDSDVPKGSQEPAASKKAATRYTCPEGLLKRLTDTFIHTAAMRQ